ncbi:MAG: prepilin-type N-terminal cleavage/methylation domain-containing protein [candidate division Zixibacteria bacterium]
MPDIGKQTGYSLVELVVVLVIIGIMATVAISGFRSAVDTSRTLETVAELDRLAKAISGNPEVLSSGIRTDYGYIGDIGSLPSNLDALVANPGLGTWDGPYLKDYFANSGSDSYFKQDAWGSQYTYSGGITIISSGNGSAISRQIAGSLADLTNNSATIILTDLSFSPPGSIFRDSVRLELSYPDGVGSIATTSRYPDDNGHTTFSGLPVGLHPLRVIYLPLSDTLNQLINIDPGDEYYDEIQLSREVW